MHARTRMLHTAGSFKARPLMTDMLIAQMLTICKRFIVFQAGIFTLGCFYRNQEVKFMSMYGSVTDAQVFSRELSSQEMVDITSCRSGELHCASRAHDCVQILPARRHHQLGPGALEPQVPLEPVRGRDARPGEGRVRRQGLELFNLTLMDVHPYSKYSEKAIRRATHLLASRIF